MTSRDTSVEAQRRQLEVYRTMSGPERVQLAIEMAEQTKRITLDGLRTRNPELDEVELHRLWFRLLHGDACNSWRRRRTAALS
ncbi:MAG: hypothetical protein GY925_26105 [Actinomycetia bacterium]|nr:hypothetical protein [Actinomycetes bacterium]